MVKKDWYPAENVKTTPKRFKPKPTKLRKSITPGTVLILLVGRFKGKRVVFLKQLASGLLAVTGPFKLNGVPIRRVHQATTLSTSTKVDLAKVDVAKITDETFKKETATKGTKAQKFFKDNLPKVSTSDARKALQKSVDTALLANIKDKVVQKYIGARFTLTRKDAPHAMCF
jgi:large subunit ribosomal protein L6e